jgi:asparagine synthase (glutamine-hydrolysing)
LIEYASAQVTDEQLAAAAERFPYNTPATKEAYFYRDIFHKHYPQVSAAQTVRKWIRNGKRTKTRAGVPMRRT